MFTQLYMHLIIDYKSCDRCSSFDVTSLPNNLTSRWQEGRQSSLKMRQNHMIPPSLPSHESLYKTKKPPPSAKNNPAKIRVLRIGPKLSTPKTCHVTKSIHPKEVPCGQFLFPRLLKGKNIRKAKAGTKPPPPSPWYHMIRLSNPFTRVKRHNRKSYAGIWHVLC